MKLVIDAPVPYVKNKPVTLTVASGDVKFWLDRNKEHGVGFDVVTHTLVFPTWPTDSLGRPLASQPFWVEAPNESYSVRDIEIKVSYQQATDRVRATAVWAYLHRWESDTNDWAAIAASWDQLPQTLQTMLGTDGSNGTGLRPVNDASVNVIVQEWVVVPTGLAKEPVYVDISRRIERIAWKYDPADSKWKEFVTNQEYFTLKDYANDDLDNDDESSLNSHDFIFSADAPGFPPKLPRNFDINTKFLYRANFQEFIRFSFDNRPKGNGLGGSRGSDFFDWKSKLKATFELRLAESDSVFWFREGGNGPGSESLPKLP